MKSKLFIIVVLLLIMQGVNAQVKYTKTEKEYLKKVYRPIVEASMEIREGSMEYTETIYSDNKVITNNCKAYFLVRPHVNTLLPLLYISVNKDSVIYLIAEDKCYEINIKNSMVKISDTKEALQMYDNPFLSFYFDVKANMYGMPSEVLKTETVNGVLTAEYDVKNYQEHNGIYKYVYNSKKKLLEQMSYSPQSGQNNKCRYSKKEYQLVQYNAFFSAVPFTKFINIINNYECEK